MRKYLTLCLAIAALCACDKHDPILAGTRTAVFDTADNISVLNTPIEKLSASAFVMPDADCPYTQNSDNVIMNGNRRIFSGFPTNNSVKSDQKPVCSGNYVYAGLTTGELVKVNAKTRQIAWIADIYRTSNMTGGASVLDIIAPIIVNENAVYVGGLGDAFCRVNATSGAKQWCLNISVAHPFILTNNAAFVLASDNNLYAVRLTDGAVYWRSPVRRAATPVYQDKTITVGRQKFDATTGEIIK